MRGEEPSGEAMNGGECECWAVRRGEGGKNDKRPS